MGWFDSIFGGGDSGGGGSWWEPILNWGTKYLSSSGGGAKNPTWFDRYAPIIGVGGSVVGNILDYYQAADANRAQKEAAEMWMDWMQRNNAANAQAYQDYVNQWYGQPGGNGAPSGYTLVGTDPAEIDAARMEALAEAQQRLEAGYSDALKTLAPYRKSAKRLLPKMEATYGQGVKGIGQLYGQLFESNPEYESALAQKFGYDEFIKGRR